MIELRAEAAREIAARTVNAARLGSAAKSIRQRLPSLSLPEQMDAMLEFKNLEDEAERESLKIIELEKQAVQSKSEVKD